MSLTARLTLAASLVLAACLGLAGYALDRAFRDAAENAVRERLQAHIYGLLAAADLDPQGAIELPPSLPEERFQRPGSGLYAQVTSKAGTVVWQSPSQLGRELPVMATVPTGEWRFERERSGLFMLGLGVVWEMNNKSIAYTFSVSEEPTAYMAQVNGFRRGLWIWFAALAAGLLIAQLFVLRWGLKPLRRAERDLAAVEAGTQEALTGQYPRELRGLTDNLNALLRTERGRLARYRDALADLAHSLKTPLAVLRGAGQSQASDGDLPQIVREQTERMNQIVDYQLQRAATSGRSALLAPVAVAPLVQRIVKSLEKVYAGRGFNFSLDIEADLHFRCDESDLLELCGNLLDNACKFAHRKIRLQAGTQQSGTGPTLLLQIEDDGPGIEPAQREAVLARGVRTDSTVPGQGIGLAVVRDIVQAYGGHVGINQSAALGGACISLHLPTT